MRSFRHAILLVTGLVISSASTAFPPTVVAQDLDPLKNWQARELLAHPLVGKIWSRRQGGLVSLSRLGAAVTTADHVLLGEVHDNPDSHRLQAWALAQRVRQKTPLIVVMEMLNDAQRPVLDAVFADAAGTGKRRKRMNVTVEDLFARLNWKTSGWPDAKLYAPVLDVVLRNGGILVAGSASRKQVRRIGKKGLEALSAEKVRKLALNQPLDKAAIKALREELLEGHCNMLPKKALPGMVTVQRFRDARMARAMVDAAEGAAGSVLIAGNGHVRTDRAVPWYLRRMHPNARIVSVMTLEVQQDETDLKSYLPLDSRGRAAVDFIVFVPRQERKDQCEELRKMFRSHKIRR